MKQPTRFEKLGLGRSVKLSWMNMALSYVMTGLSAEECREKLATFIAEEQTEDGHRGAESVRKALRYTACWFKPVADLVLFRDQAIAVARACSITDWTPIQYAMLVANYPFLLAVSTVIGRLLAVQGTVCKPQIEKRLQDQYGAQAVVERNMRYAINILLDFGLLFTEKARSGIYEAPAQSIELDFDRTALLWKAMIHATPSGRLPAVILRNAPALYPFRPASLAPSSVVARFPDLDFQIYSSSHEQLFLR